VKNLAIGFSSFRPKQYSEEVCDFREREYFVCIRQILKILPQSFDFILCENTVDFETEINNSDLRNLIKDVNFCAMGSESNIGSNNKGVGELSQLKAALEEVNPSDYENISYVTTRGILTCPYVFEKTERLEKQALLGNPDFIWMDGRVASATSNLFNDQFFSMKSNVMVDFSNFSFNRFDYLINNHIGSEYNLYDFVVQNNIDYEELNYLGRIRNDWSANGVPFDGNNFHFC